MQDDEEDVDIALELRRYLTDVSARLATVDHYSLLEVPRDADEKTIKRAYFRLSALLHPDRFFKKRLGKYKAMLQRVFAQLTTAYETLSSKERRAKYDAALASQPAGFIAAPAPAPSAPPPSPPSTPPAADPTAQGKRQAAVDALKQRFLDARASARQHAESAARARAAGDFVSAAEAYRSALRYAPGDATLKAALDEVERAGSARVAESRRQQALLEERYGHWAEAAASWRKVAELCPDDEEARSRHASALERSRGARR
jgi:curved DNA-binding protein CbpA